MQCTLCFALIECIKCTHASRIKMEKAVCSVPYKQEGEPEDHLGCDLLCRHPAYVSPEIAFSVWIVSGVPFQKDFTDGEFLGREISPWHDLRQPPFFTFLRAKQQESKSITNLSPYLSEASSFIEMITLYHC